MKFLSIILVVCLPFLVSAQISQSPVPDSISVKSKSIMIPRGKNPPKLGSFIVPAVFLGYGALSLGNNAVRNLDYSTRNELQEDHPLFANHADDYLRFVPAAAVYALNLAGIKGKHSVVDQTGLYFLSMGIMEVSTTVVKRAVDRKRPDGADNYSFPSGHTASAFAAAEFLNQEYRDVSPWIGYAGYTVATATGVLRMYNNRHWVSDVVAGAGFGIASTKVAYLIYPHLRKLFVGKQSIYYSMLPTYQQKTVGIVFGGTF